MKADRWTSAAHHNCVRIHHGAAVDKTVCKKNLGRATCFYLKAEQERQHGYLNNKPYVSPDEAMERLKEGYSVKSSMIDVMLFNRQLTSIFDHDIADDTTSMKSRRRRIWSESTEITEHLAINQLDLLHDQPLQHDITMDFCRHLIPAYNVEPLKYLWYEAEKWRLFPPWANVGGMQCVWKRGNDVHNVIMECNYKKLGEGIDLTLANRLLSLIVNYNLANYYKDVKVMKKLRTGLNTDKWPKRKIVKSSIVDHALFILVLASRAPGLSRHQIGRSDWQTTQVLEY